MKPARDPASRPLRATRRPFTVVVCTACAADGDSLALDALRATIRRCDHGLLITTGCLQGANGCARSSARGVTVVVQPCAIDRRPEGPARRFGPLRGVEDVLAVCRWLRRGDWDSNRN